PGLDDKRICSWNALAIAALADAGAVLGRADYLDAARGCAEFVLTELRGPDGDPVSGVAITVGQQGTTVGKATTGEEGAWRVALPGPGTYDITLDPATLPKGLQLRTAGGSTLRDVSVTPDQQRTVIFPLTTAGSQKEGQTPGDTATPAPERPPDQQGPSPLDRLLRLLVEGIKFGAIIAITAVGLSLIFGTTHIINFAHGELVTIGATVAFFLNAATVGP
ncbi:MAG: branched-chain amino acid ABC transporter permease, partial [Solirubrobacterales bacterium]|nr:branched-chain amino acid ABC transporter permease [Solirubrobacterales bacterium]